MHLRCQLRPGRVFVNRLAAPHTIFVPRTFATALDLSQLSEVPGVPKLQEEPGEDVEEAEAPHPLKRPPGGDLGSHLPKHIIPKNAYIPAYPYGHRQLFKQANKGLYGDQTIQFGNNVSRDTETKTRRYWKPNILAKALYSVALKKRIKLRVAARVLKTIDREGGLDEYLLKDSEHRIKELGPLGWALRWTLMQKTVVIDRLRSEAAALGVDQTVIDKQWPTQQMMVEQRAAQTISEGFEQGEFGTLEEQGLWEPEEDGTFENHDASSLTLSKPSKPEKKAAHRAVKEYRVNLTCAKRYLDRGLVNSEAEGIKVAFVRQKERRAAAIRQKEKYDENLEQKFSAKELEELKAKLKQPEMPDKLARKIAYGLEKTKGIQEAGNYLQWRKNVEAARLASIKAVTKDKGERSDWPASKKAEYAQQLQEAESAEARKKLDAESAKHTSRMPSTKPTWPSKQGRLAAKRNTRR